MKQRINLLTLGVSDLKQSMKFYQEGLGWQTQGIVGTEYENGAVVLFELDNGMVLCLYERKIWPGTVMYNLCPKTQQNLQWDTLLIVTKK